MPNFQIIATAYHAGDKIRADIFLADEEGNPDAIEAPNAEQAQQIGEARLVNRLGPGWATLHIEAVEIA